MPDTDPITNMLLRSILQAMDEWHSLTSKAKRLVAATMLAQSGQGSTKTVLLERLKVETEPDVKAALAKASDPWVRETAAYMQVRVAFSAAQAAAFSQYGDYQPKAADQAEVAQAREQL